MGIKVEILKKIDKKKAQISILYIFLIWFSFTLIDLIYSLVNKNYQFGMNWYLLISIILTSTLPKSKHRIIIYSLILIFSFTELVHFEYYGSLLRAIEFYAIFTNINDITQSFFSSLAILIYPSILVIISFTLLVFINKKFSNIIYTFKYSSRLLLVLLFIFIINDVRIVYRTSNKLYSKSSKMIYPIAGNSSSFNLFKSINYFIIGIMPKKIMGHNSHFKSLPEPKLVLKNPDINVIFIIGETLRAKNVSFLDYKEEDTTPLLKKLFKEHSDKTFHNWVYSGGTMTKTSVAVLVNRLKYPGATQQIVEQKNCIFNLAKSNNFDTYFISSQEKQYLTIIHTLICNKYLNENLARDDFKRELGQTTGLDEDLLKFIKKIDLENKNNLITLEMQGSHSPYEIRSPKSFKKFKSEYNNSILYSDYVLTSVIEYILKNVKKKTYFFYVSDHGELLNEKGHKGHGWFEPEVYRVPFIFASNKPISKEMKIHLNNIKSHYDISSTITKLLGYDTNIDSMEKKTIYINGSDLDALGGFIKIEIEGGQKISLKRNN